MCIEVTWIGGANDSCHLKGPRKDHVLRYDALTSKDRLVFTSIYIKGI